MKATDRKVLPASRAGEWWEIEYQRESYQQYVKLEGRYPKRRQAVRAAKRHVLAQGRGICRVVRVLEVRFTGFHDLISYHRAAGNRTLVEGGS